jgi:hypothetical protein
MNKLKKSFTLSTGSVAFLEAVRHERQAPSDSAVLDEMLQEQERQWRLRQLEKEVTAMYGELSPEARAEEVAWGEFALQQWPVDVGDSE